MEKKKEIGKVKIDEGKFNAIKGALRNGMSMQYVKSAFDISQGTAYNIRCSDTYEDYRERIKPNKAGTQRLMNEDKFEQIKKLIAENKSVNYVKTVAGISSATFYKVKASDSLEEYRAKYQVAHNSDKNADGTMKPKVDQNKFDLIKLLNTAGVSIEKIEELSGVSSTTIYDVTRSDSLEDYRNLLIERDRARREAAKEKAEQEARKQKEIEELNAQQTMKPEIKPDFTESYLQQIVDLLKEINDKLGKEEQPEPEKKRGWFSKAPF